MTLQHDPLKADEVSDQHASPGLGAGNQATPRIAFDAEVPLLPNWPMRPRISILPDPWHPRAHRIL